AHFADAKFYLKNRISKEVGYDSTMPTKKVDIAKKADVPVRDMKIIVEKDRALSNMNKVPKMN
ncbi:hypothetical protein HAX54_046928, partial [Datura stramonium]|nr:hypothetical protein [Datura stramonium]